MDEFTELIPGLPDELAKMCLIRVPRRFHRAIRFVSREWFSFLRSPEYSLLRKKEGVSEEWLYIITRDTTEKLSCHSFDPRTRKWQALPPLPPECERAYGLSCVSCCGKLYLMGGAGWFKSSRPDVFCYDPVLDRWSRAGCLSIARCYALAAVLNDRIYVIGGMGSTTSGLLKSVEIYDPRDDSSRIAEDLPFESDLEDCVVYKGRIYVRDIKSIHHTPDMDSAYCYDPATLQWTVERKGMVWDWNGPTTSFDGCLYMILNAFSIRILKFDEDSSSWTNVGTLSSNLMPPHRLIAMDGKLFIIGRGGAMKIVQISSLEKQKHVTVTRSVEGLSSIKDMVIGCFTLEL